MSIAPDPYNPDIVRERQRPLLDKIASADVWGRRGHAALIDACFDKPYSRAPLKGVLPERLWKHIEAYGDPVSTKSIVVLALECALVRAACIFAQSAYGITSEHLDRAIHFEQNIGDRLQKLARERREKGIVE